MFRSIVSFGCAALMFIGALSVGAQDNNPATYAGVLDDILVIQQGDNTASVANPENRGFITPVWSDDGSKIAYLLIDSNFTYHLMVANADGSDPVQLANAGRLEIGYPISWTPDGQILFASSPETFPTSPDPYQVTINSIAPQADAVPQAVASVPVGVGCGGGSPYPTDWQYWMETGFGGSFLTLQSTDFGILYSVVCGGTGYALLDPNTGESRYLTPAEINPDGMIGVDDNISRAKLSPDGAQLVAIRTNYQEPSPISTVVVIDLATGTITEVPTSMQPDQVAWSASGDIYYAARATADPDLMDDLTDEQRARIDAVWQGLTASSNTVTISRVNPATGEETLLHSTDAYTVARLVEASDGSLWFSLVPNLLPWLQAVGDSTVDPINDPDNHAQLDTVPVSVYRLMDGSATLVEQNFNQFTLLPQ